MGADVSPRESGLLLPPQALGEVGTAGEGGGRGWRWALRARALQGTATAWLERKRRVAACGGGRTLLAALSFLSPAAVAELPAASGMDMSSSPTD